MNAFNTVNLAAAVLVTSVENARNLGIPEEKWVYPLAGAGRKEKERCESPGLGSLSDMGADQQAVWERPNFYHSQAISVALDECLEASGLKIDDMDALDLYSYALHLRRSVWLIVSQCASVVFPSSLNWPVIILAFPLPILPNR